jgi:hypothetical protein
MLRHPFPGLSLRVRLARGAIAPAALFVHVVEK